MTRVSFGVGRGRPRGPVGVDRRGRREEQASDRGNGGVSETGVDLPRSVRWRYGFWGCHGVGSPRSKVLLRFCVGLEGPLEVGVGRRFPEDRKSWG